MIRRIELDGRDQLLETVHVERARLVDLHAAEHAHGDRNVLNILEHTPGCHENGLRLGRLRDDLLGIAGSGQHRGICIVALCDNGRVRAIRLRVRRRNENRGSGCRKQRQFEF